MRDERAGYAVVLKRDYDGEPFFAAGIVGQVPPCVFYRRQAAVKFRDELAKQGCRKGKVVKVRVVVETVEGES